jgi:hypothetical protein
LRDHAIRKQVAEWQLTALQILALQKLKLSPKTAIAHD